MVCVRRSERMGEKAFMWLFYTFFVSKIKSVNEISWIINNFFKINF
jgi:hypothetical protein